MSASNGGDQESLRLLKNLVLAVSNCTKCYCSNNITAEKENREEKEVKKVLKVLLGRNPTIEEIKQTLNR